MSIVVNMDKARDIWRDNFRQRREDMWEDVDVEFMVALEAGDVAKQQEVAEKKQLLRDVTLTDLSTANTPSELKQVWPDILGDQPDELKD